MNTQQPAGTVPQQQISIELGEREAEGIYSNLALISHSSSEVIIDFARVLPGSPKSKVYARIVMTPTHAKSLLQALEGNLRTYETTHGKIRTVPGDDKVNRPTSQRVLALSARGLLWTTSGYQIPGSLRPRRTRRHSETMIPWRRCCPHNSIAFAASVTGWRSC